jgi:ABC-type Fe3+/spermidine/putrescine transport system ATPase subunit
VRVELEHVRFAYARGGLAVLPDLSLALPEGQISVVIGPSAAGKSTLLRLLAGLAHPQAGAVRFDGSNVAGTPAERRDVGVVFQSYALFPHLSVYDNVAFGLRARRRGPRGADLDRRVRETASLLGLEPLLARKPAELSGGEQQRVAVARAISPRPALLLLDEPLSALDARLRRAVRGELAALLRRLGTTVLYVTHDQEEAMLLADHLVVLRDGEIEQAGEPLALYREPATPFVASFLGEANLVAATVTERAEGGPCPPVLETSLGAFAARDGAAAPGARGFLLMRPEDLTAAADGLGAEATVVEARGLGPYDRVVVRTAAGVELLLHLAPGSTPAIGSTLRLAVRPRRLHFLPGA